ncbi:MAG: ABC transporter substrate-binding protein [Bryobacteraceae bacterium]|nr:ABC transporter substrate-binding protein [Bryobacteraceae bacterium]
MSGERSTMLRRQLLAFTPLLAFAQQTKPIPKRIVSTAPGITEILFAMGLGSSVVGVTQYCKYPASVTKLPKVGTWMAPNMEVILSLRPDLVVVQQTAIQNSAKFEGVGLKTLDVRLDRIADIFTTVRAIGDSAGVQDRATRLTSEIQGQLQDVKRRLGNARPTPALFVVGRNPGSLEGVIAVGPLSYLDEVISAAGGKNILGDARVPYVKVVQEEIVSRNPEVIIDMGEHADANAISTAQAQSEIGLWGRYPTIPAVRNKRVHIVASELFVVPGPRVVECARRLAALLHPELFQ